jgi:hypothetical protein
MNHAPGHYSFSIGLADPDGSLHYGNAPAWVQTAKKRLRNEVFGLLSKVTVPFSFDLNSLMLANGLYSRLGDHFQIGDEVHLAVARHWLAALNQELRPNDRLWIPEPQQPTQRASGSRSPASNPMTILCCRYEGKVWTSCGSLALAKGPSEDEASPWTVSASKKGARPVELPVSLEVSWTCEVHPHGAAPMMRPQQVLN